jgi:urease accessory protein
MIIWPVTFMLAMLGGFAVASAGLQVGFIEVIISLSVMLLGAFIAVELKTPVLPGAAIIGLFAFFHGHAHGAEATSMQLPYVAGFTTATAALLAIGIMAGMWTRSSTGRLVARAAAGCSAFIAAFLLWGGS